MIRYVKLLKSFFIALGLSLLYWVLVFFVLSNNANFKSFRYMGF